MMKTWIKKLLVVLLSMVLSIVAFTACTQSKVDLELVGKPIMTVTYDEEDKTYLLVLEGFVKTTSGQNCENAWVYVQFYDEVGDPILTGTEMISYIDAGETWHFYMERSVDIAPTRYEVENTYAYLVEVES